MADVIEQLFGRIVFATGKTEYPWEDVILASALGPDWQEVVEKARLGAALVTASEESEDSPISDEDVEAAANEFRYDRDLLTADEVEVWLTRWGLEVDTWMSWISADLLRKNSDEESLKAAAAVEIDAEDLAAAVHAEAVLSGALARLAYRLAGRVSISDKLWEQGPGEADEPEPQIPASVDPEALVPNLPPGEARLRLVWLAKREAAFQRATASAVTPASIEARVRSNQSDWMRVTTRSIELPGEDMAREALFSIREDGLEMSEVAQDTKAEMSEGTHFLAELPPSVRDVLLAAQKGELLGPIKVDDSFAIYQLVDKVLATSKDPAIVARAEQSILANVVSREVDNRVSWRWPL